MTFPAGPTKSRHFYPFCNKNSEVTKSHLGGDDDDDGGEGNITNMMMVMVVIFRRFDLKYESVLPKWVSGRFQTPAV